MRRVIRHLLAPLALVAACVPAMAGVAAAASSSPLYPSVKGGFGSTPSITYPATNPPSALEAKTLVQGSGPKVQKGELLVANYLGELWRGKVFDSSFSRKQLAAFPIGLGDVIPGWDKTLVGVRAGSRVLLVLPPVDGYGAKGNSGAGIKGNSTLVFVVDVVAAYPKTITGDLHATNVKSAVGGITVTGALGKQPVIKIAKSAVAPSKVTATLIATGSGPKVHSGLVVLQYVVTDWTGRVLQSTWSSGLPDGENVGISGQSSALDGIVGMPIGSRVLLELPKNSNGGPFALALDIAAQPKS